MPFVTRLCQAADHELTDVVSVPRSTGSDVARILAKHGYEPLRRLQYKLINLVRSMLQCDEELGSGVVVGRRLDKCR